MKRYWITGWLLTLFLPFCSLATDVSVIPAFDVIQGGQTVVYDINISDVNALEGFTLKITYNSDDFENISATPGTFLSPDPNDLQFITDNSVPGVIDISCTLLTGQSGASGNGTLLHLHLTAKMVNTISGSPLTLSNVVLRDIFNQTIACTPHNGLVIIDSNGPEMNGNLPLTEPQNAYYNEPPVLSASSFVFTDNYNLHSVDFKTDNNSWQELISGVTGNLYPDPASSWTLPNFYSMNEGEHAIHWRADDDVELQNTWIWIFNKDIQPPEGIQSMTFAPILTDGLTITASVLTDNTQGEVYYEFNCITNSAYDRERIANANTFTVTGLTPNTPYTFRYRGSDGVTNNAATQLENECNYTEWSVPYSRYTLSLPPSETTVTCDKNAGQWYNAHLFTFTAVGGFGDGCPVAYYRYAWNRESTHTWAGNEAIWDENATTATTLALTATENGDNWYLHLQGYNGDNAANGTLSMGPFQFDATLPFNVSALTANTSANSNESVDLTWNDPESDAAWIHIFAKPFGIDGVGTYPLYNGTTPVAPSYENAVVEHWTELATVAAGTETYCHTPAARNEWHYVLFVEDAAGNISTGSPCTVALSYWLGDVTTPGDGKVTTNDIGLLAASWGANGLEEPHLFRNVGPTLDHSRFSRPLPDAFINFEDLMIFSMNYGNTSCITKKQHPLMETLPITLTLDKRNLSHHHEISLQLSSTSNELKGMEIKLKAEKPGLISNINAGSLLSKEDFFLWEHENGSILLTLTKLSTKSFDETGEIARFIVEGCPGLEIESITARNLRNENLEVKVKTVVTSDTQELVQICNYPNPFSESTRIEFSTLTSGNLLMEVYDLSGRKVAEPWNDLITKGIHNVHWNGHNLSGQRLPRGVYFITVRFCGKTTNHKVFIQR
ncbi:MAG: T9SS type A sorting domain-containing protein [Bacteroidia bacterium]|nr:T9SS type A sorting domain-containing protein [Bacteroidia bacterium]